MPYLLLDLTQIVGPSDGAALIGRSAARIAYWRRTGLLVPVIATAGRHFYRIEASFGSATRRTRASRRGSGRASHDGGAARRRDARARRVRSR